jgi:hypothetical protein
MNKYKIMPETSHFDVHLASNQQVYGGGLFHLLAGLSLVDSHWDENSHWQLPQSWLNQLNIGLSY